MNSALLLVDLQHDFLRSELDEGAERLVSAAARLLAQCRARQFLVVHVWTSASRDNDRRMPHWRAAGDWRCELGTPGHAVPGLLAPQRGELVIHKAGFSPFVEPELSQCLEHAGIERVWVAGLHLHACVRATALDAHQRGWLVGVVEDAVGSDDPLHAAITQRYLERRGVPFVSTDQLSSASPSLPAPILPEIDRDLLQRWQATDPAERAAPILRLAGRLRAACEPLAALLAGEISKPIRLARAEIERSARLCEAAVRSAAVPYRAEPTVAGVSARRVPHGVIAAITPWNNPLAIPIGKLAPALLHGNGAIWKPSPLTPRLNASFESLLREVGIPSELLSHLAGDAATASALVSRGAIDAVSFTGGPRAGWSVQELCASRSLPLQAELGGNNAAIVTSGAERLEAARRIVAGAFGFAGQRCTANRRVIVPDQDAGRWIEALIAAATDLPCGDPRDERTLCGPLVSAAAARRTAELVARCDVSWSGAALPHADYFPPTIVTGEDPRHEVVQHESFAPVLVVQHADSFEHALALCNGVRQGLAAALFGAEPAQRERFAATVRAGIIKFDDSTVDADAEHPFGGWKRSGVGPPEHGVGAREFFTRWQTRYDGPAGR